MSYLVLARKWRPQTFEAVLGQEHITRVLINAIKSSRLAHAFLFSGPRGVGKTSTARILAKALNCDQGPTPTPCNQCSVCREITSGSSSSIIEIDGASNNSVDDIRHLREKVGMIPTTGRYKVYIIDEVHMLSQAAFNALLKTLEEPPSHVKFIFATTEVHKIPPTILSRCQRFDFRRISMNKIIANLQMILDQEKISTTPRVLTTITKAADGSMRDALSIFDQILSACGKEITENDVESILGIMGREKLEIMAEAIVRGDAAASLNQLEKILTMGSSLESYWQQLLEFFRDGLMIRIAEGRGVNLSQDEVRSVEILFDPLSVEDLIRILKSMAEGLDRFRSSQQPRVLAEMILLKLCDSRRYVGLDEIVSRLKDLEKSLRNNSPEPVRTAKPTRTSGPAKAPENIPANSPESTPQLPPRANIPLPGDHATTENSPQTQGHAKIEESSPPGPENTDDKKALYETLIGRIKSVKKSLGALLPHGSIIELNGERVVLGFEKGFARMVNSKNNIDLLQTELGKILNRSIRVEFAQEDSSAQRLPASRDAQSSWKENGLKEIEENPVFNKIMEMFDTKIIQIKKTND